VEDLDLAVWAFREDALEGVFKGDCPAVLLAEQGAGYWASL
jgi:hypothetical protein